MADRAAADAARQHVRRLAAAGRQDALRRVAALLRGDPDHLVADALRRSRLTVNFHPDRLVGDRTVVDRLADDGVYLSQFVTGISSGGLTAFPGGDRDVWEQRMYGGAYQRPGVTPADRPVYGGLDLAGHPDGAAPRFGSCYLQLHAAALGRATFSHGDSVTEPSVVGTADVFEPILAAILSDVERTGCALGESAADPLSWWNRLASAARSAPGRCMDDYVEAQIHGGVDLRHDVVAVVADESLRGTPTGDALAVLPHRYGPALRWRPGFTLSPEQVPADLRGATAPKLAVRVCAHFGVERLNAAVLGRAAAVPGEWAEFGDPAQVLQQLKYLWHILVLTGS